MTPAVFEVSETPAEISLPVVDAVLILNSSAGLGDTSGAPDVVLNTGSPASLDPQVGVRLRPGELFTMPLCSPSNGCQLPLYAVADGPGGQIELELIFDE